MRPAVANDLAQTLKKVDRPATFCVSGALPAVLPGLVVDDVGPVALPLTATQAKELRAQCEQAPYGKGEKTLIDTSVRRVWRLQPKHFNLTNPEWQPFLDRIVAAVQKELGLAKPKLQSHLYDLLLYEPGSFFLPHKDGEKLDRMVATLVVVLPSSHLGGELVVRHDGQERTVDFSGSATASFQVQYAAFYADCEHEVRPMQHGHRLCLIYNLTLAKGKKGIAAPRSAAQVDAIAAMLGQWAAESGPEKLVVMLDHQYTADGLAWDTLKGADRAKANVLAEAAERAGCKAYLSLLTFYESGSAEGDYEEYYGGRYGRRRQWYNRYEQDEEDDFDDDTDDEDEDTAGEYEMGEVYESSLTADHFHDRAGNGLPFNSMTVDEAELLDPKALTGVKPEEEYEGFTGNEGMTLQRWYRHAAVVLWPQKHHFAILCNGNGPRALPLLQQMVGELHRAGRAKTAALKGQCTALASAILAQWPEQAYVNRYAEDMGHGDVPKTLAELDDPALIRTYVGTVLLRDAAADPGKSLGKIVAHFGWSAFQRELSAVVEATTAVTLERNVRLVEQICLAKPRNQDGWAELCRTLGHALLAALGAVDQAPQTYDWRVQAVNRANVLVGLVRALLASEQDDLLEQVIAHVVALPARYPLTDVQMPALVELQPWLKRHLKSGSAALTAWLESCREQLETLTAEEPQEPADFRRPAPIACKCELCAELKRFLQDPHEAVHRFSIRQDRRDHLAMTIRHDHCDVDTRTEKTRSPYTLVCTKNTASYKAALKKYHEDLDDLATVKAIAAALPTATRSLR